MAQVVKKSFRQTVRRQRMLTRTWGTLIFFTLMLTVFNPLRYVGDFESISALIAAKSANETISTSSFDDVNATPSLFNCESKFGQCKYFYPTEFFSESDASNIEGPGYEFFHIYQHLMELMEEGQLWQNMPRVGSPTFSYAETRHNPILDKPFCRHNVTFVHVHKAGGTTIMNAYKNKGTFQKFTRNPLYNSRTFKPGSKLQDDYLKTVTKYKPRPDEWKTDDHVLFAFIRDPLDRFISSIGQAMGATGSGNNVIGKVLQEECILVPEYTPENSRHTLQCCIDFVKRKGYDVEIHFTPQAIEIAFATQMYPVPVSVFSFEESYKYVLMEMGIDPDDKHRDGSKPGYRSNKLLTEMSSADYDEGLKRQVCELYRVDVLMSRYLGMPFSSCDDYI